MPRPLLTVLALLVLPSASNLLAASRFHDLPDSPQLRGIDRMLSIQMIGLSEHLLALSQDEANEAKGELVRLALSRSEGWEAEAARFAARDMYGLVMMPDQLKDRIFDEHWVQDMGGMENAARYQANVAKLALKLRTHRHELSLYRQEIARQAAALNPEIFILNSDLIMARLDTIDRLVLGEDIATYPENAKLKSYNLPGRRHIPKKPGKS